MGSFNLKNGARPRQTACGICSHSELPSAACGGAGTDRAHSHCMSEGAYVPVVGTPVVRVEDLRLVRGRGQFVGDLHRDGMLHAAVVRSEFAHGRVRAIDTGPGLAMPGVRAVFTAADVAAASNGKI